MLVGRRLVGPVRETPRRAHDPGHRPPAAPLRAADLIAVPERGRIADTGTHRELLARCEAYERLVRSRADTAVLPTGASEAPVPLPDERR